MIKFNSSLSLAVCLVLVLVFDTLASTSSRVYLSSDHAESASSTEYGFTSSAMFPLMFGPPRATINSSNPRLSGVLLDMSSSNPNFPDVLLDRDIVKMLAQLNSGANPINTGVTNQDYLNYLSNPLTTVPKAGFLSFVRSRNFGGKRFLNWLNAQSDNVFLGGIASRISFTAGRDTTTFTFPFTTLRRLAAVPGSVPDTVPTVDGQKGLGLDSRFFIWDGFPPAPLQVNSVQ